MNDESRRTKPLGIEWEFNEGVPDVVVHIFREGVRDWEVWSLLNADLEDMSALQRETVRAWLLVIQHRLDDSEPAVTTGVLR